MYNIKYGIELNENGRPYVGLPDDYEQRPEDRFFVLEVVRYIFLDILKRNNDKLDDDTVNKLNDAEKLIGQISDNVAKILYDNMKAQGELDLMLDKKFHVIVKNIEERNALPEKNILFMEKIFDRVEGLRVCVSLANDGILGWNNNFEPVLDIYELVDGITNEHWVKI